MFFLSFVAKMPKKRSSRKRKLISEAVSDRHKRKKESDKDDQDNTAIVSVPSDSSVVETADSVVTAVSTRSPSPLPSTSSVVCPVYHLDDDWRYDDHKPYFFLQLQCCSYKNVKKKSNLIQYI